MLDYEINCIWGGNKTEKFKKRMVVIKEENEESFNDLIYSFLPRSRFIRLIFFCRAVKINDLDFPR